MNADELLDRLAAEDSFAVVEQLSAMPVATAAQLYADAVVHAYWKRKDLSAVVALARAGVQHALTASLATSNPEHREKLRSTAKAIAYNLASFTWPGWDEPGITCTPGDAAAGFDAAKVSLRLVREMNKGDLQMSRGLWILAGHRLAQGDRTGAIADFQRAAEHAKAAGSAADQWLCTGFAAMVRLLRTPGDPSATDSLTQARAALKPLDDGEMFIGQIETAARVFGARASRAPMSS